MRKQNLCDTVLNTVKRSFSLNIPIELISAEMADRQSLLHCQRASHDRENVQKGLGRYKRGEYSTLPRRYFRSLFPSTYKKEKNSSLQWFREEVSRESDLEGETAVGLIELLADAHGPCLQEMESRLARWESNARHNIGDFLYNTLLNVLPLYDQYLENLIPVLEKMEYSIRTSRRFDQLCRDFESQKHCYLPLSSFLLKPLQRLLHYNSIIDRKYDEKNFNIREIELLQRSIDF